VAIAGVGIAYLGSSSSSSEDSSPSSAGGVAVAPELATVPSGAVTSTNRNYSAESLQGSAVTPFTAGTDNAPLSAPSPRGESRSTKSSASHDGLADPLSRLRPQAALEACLDAIGSANGAGAITVQTVDYARFAGQPALVVHFTAANGAWAWVSGPTCGLTGVGPATAYSVRVG
jgi:hypothetical protein